MHKLLLPILTLVFLMLEINAQNTDIRNIDYQLATQSIDRLELKSIDNAKLLRKYHGNNKSVTSKSLSKPFQFAEPRIVNISSRSRGNWIDTKDGFIEWKLIVKSKNAKSLNIVLYAEEMPKNISWSMYNVSGKMNQGVWKKSTSKKLFTPLMLGDELLLVLRILKQEKDNFNIKIEKVNHDFVGFQEKIKSEGCHLDVVCGEENGYDIVEKYRNQIRSVGVYTLEGAWTCSGTLLNNTSNDCDPLFLTAHHCGINETNSESVIIYWNYDNSNCRKISSVENSIVGDGKLDQYSTGTKLLTRNEEGDACLLRIAEKINDDFKPYYSGWDISNEILDSSASIHHPNTDEKRISFYFDTLGVVSGNSKLRIESWDIGTTESGSSGGGLFSKEGLIIGQLEGGSASCQNLSYDLYGNLAYNWNIVSTEYPKSIGEFLDPSQIGINKFQGRDCNSSYFISPSTFTGCWSNKDTFIAQIIGLDSLRTFSITTDTLPQGYEVLLDNKNLSLGDTFALRIIVQGGVDTIFRFKIYFTDSIETSFWEIGLNGSGNLPAIPTLLYPSDSLFKIGSNMTFNWGDVSERYDFQLWDSTNKLIYQVLNFSNPFLKYTDLKSNTQYYWRIRSNNHCGYSDWSKYRSFHTALFECHELQSFDLPLLIGENEGAEVESSINFPNQSEITELSISKIRGNHDYFIDLEFQLKSPKHSFILLSEQCEGEDGKFSFGFHDSSTILTPKCPPNSGQILRPFETFSRSNGSSSKGVYTLRVKDNALNDGGKLDQFNLKVCTNQEQNKGLQIQPLQRVICNKSSLIDQEIKLFFAKGENRYRYAHITSSGTVSLSNIRYDKDTIKTGDTLIVKYDRLIPHRNLDTLFISAIYDDSTTELFQMHIFNGNEPNIPTLISPKHQADTIKGFLTFEWEDGAAPYRLSIYNNRDREKNPIFSSGGIYQKVKTINIDSIAEGLENYLWTIEGSGTCWNPISNPKIFRTAEKTLPIREVNPDFWSISPNPSSDWLSFQWKKDISTQKASIKIIDLMGREHLDAIINAGIKEALISVEHLPVGSYLLYLIEDSKISVNKLEIVR